MNDEYIPISTLNDFIFCPYSIYLHNVYMESDEDIYHATPQVAGKNAHTSVDQKSTSAKRTIIESLSVFSERYKIFGKIDVFNAETKTLIERKNNLKQIFQGQIYQLWAQYLCMIEMGYSIHSICFYEISTKKTISIKTPDTNDLNNFEEFLNKYRNFNPRMFSQNNTNKCAHCIYCALCDKYIFENVY